MWSYYGYKQGLLMRAEPTPGILNLCVQLSSSQIFEFIISWSGISFGQDGNIQINGLSRENPRPSPVQ